MAHASLESTFAEVFGPEGDDHTIAYRVSTAVYEESLINGRFVGRGWNAGGIVSFYDGRIDAGPHPDSHAFWIEIDGQLLASDWEWIGLETLPNDQPIPAMPAPFALHAIVTLKHRIRPITVRVHTGLDGTPILTRWLEITNTGDSDAALSAAYGWSGILQQTPRWRDHITPGDSLYSIGYMANDQHLHEGNFQWFDLPTARYAIDGRHISTGNRHRHPMFVMRNNATGEHFIGQLAWSGGYTFEFNLNTVPRTSDATALLSFRLGPNGPAPQRVIAPGETIACPEMHMGVNLGDLDRSINCMHEHMRRTVFMPPARGHGCWIETGIGPEVEITEEAVHNAIAVGGTFGAEVFFIDASWYAAPRSYWWDTVGDWDVSLERFPKGLKPFRDEVHALGMLWGLWMEAERVGPRSRIANEHPEWLLKNFNNETIGGQLNLAIPEAAAWLEQAIASVIEDNQLDFFRLDFNINGIGRVEHGAFVESHFWRYYESVYGIFDRMRARFPNVVFENCASGGARTDLGMVRRFDHTWVTDWQIAPRAFMITNGMTMALPPEKVDRVFFGQSSHLTTDVEFQMRLMMFVRSTGAPCDPGGGAANPYVNGTVNRYVKLYKEFVRPFMPTGRIFHHTPVMESPEPKGWGVLELASDDRRRGICGLFQLSNPTQPEYRLRLRGLDQGLTYNVTFETTGSTCLIDGRTLMAEGLTIRLEGALTSELLIFDAVG
jgi:alpha-galactosidase